MVFRGYLRTNPFPEEHPFSIANLQYLLDKKSLPVPLPMLRETLEKIIVNPAFRFLKKRQPTDCKISSFSYKTGSC